MAKFLIGIVLGLLVGGGLAFYFFAGAPRAGQIPGTPILPPDPNGNPPGTAQIVLRQEFFNQILQTIFRDMNAPAFPLNLTGQNADRKTEHYGLQSVPANNECEGKITLLNEGSGVLTSLRLENNRLTAPLAFRGSTSVFGNCVNFTGWAQTNFDLRYDANQQNVLGQINVETVNLDGVTPLLSGFVTPIVQQTLNTRVNPIQILQGKQINLNLPIAATNGNLQANVKDVRSEIKDNSLNLYVIYDFNGKPNP